MATVGDVVEVPVGSQFRYLQYTHDDAEFGDVVRVLPGIYEERPENLGDIVAMPEDFVCITSLPAVIDVLDAAVVSNEQVPEDSKAFPVMRASGAEDRDGKRRWWLYDGATTTPAHDVSDTALSKFPIREVVSARMLLDRLRVGWKPSMEPVRRPDDEDSRVGTVRVFFIVNSKSAATRLCGALSDLGLSEPTFEEVGDREYQVTAIDQRRTSDRSLFEVDEEMEELARRESASYDGNEVGV